MMAEVVVHDTTQRHVLLAPADEPRAPALSPVRDTDLETRLACAALELVAGVADASTVDRALVEVANRLKDFLAADGVALSLARRNGRCRLSAVSGAAQIDGGSELSRTIEDTLAGAVDHHSVQNQTHKESLARLLPDASLVCRTLAAQSGQIAGALLVWGSDPQFDRSLSERFLRLVAEPIAGALLLQDRARAGLRYRGLPSVLGKRRGLLWAALAAIGVMVMCLMPYRVTCDCAAEPSARRFVSAPFTGVFEKSVVRPGDVVDKDALLGQMDGRELRIELAALTADYDQARKSRDVNLAAGKVAQAQIDRLELERLDQQRALVEHRMANLAIKSPVAGYVIGGDLKRTEGAPMTMGQVLYEIAPLEQMIVEVAIGDDDIALVDAEQRVTIRFDACAGEEFAGRLVRIHPRSETRDSRNVFIGEVVLDEAAAALRPGMKGKARIVIKNKSLAQGLAERAWHTVTMFLGF